MEYAVDIEKPSFNGFTDRSTISLLATNILVIIFALWQGWTLASLVWVFWTQSVIIGVFNFLRILSLKQFSAEGFTSNGRPVGETAKDKIGTAVFFAVHYGLFHLTYLVFLGITFPIDTTQILFLSIVTVAFLINHAYEFKRVKAIDAVCRPNIGRLMFSPYPRIIPMHLTILLGFTLLSAWGVVFFLVLKTIADILMHVMAYRPTPAPTGV